MNYFIEWGHHYVVHFGVWVTLGMAATVYKDGLPKAKNIPGLLKSAVIVSLIMSIFSSHSHIHYLSFLGAVK
jgi:hypothetical protein